MCPGFKHSSQSYEKISHIGCSWRHFKGVIPSAVLFWREGLDFVGLPHIQLNCLVQLNAVKVRISQRACSPERGATSWDSYTFFIFFGISSCQNTNIRLFLQPFQRNKIQFWWSVTIWSHQKNTSWLLLLSLLPLPVSSSPLRREQPIFSTRAHVFQIDPNTKKNWVPTSKHAVTVSYFFDSTRNVYRIISLDGSKVCVLYTVLGTAGSKPVELFWCWYKNLLYHLWTKAVVTSTPTVVMIFACTLTRQTYNTPGKQWSVCGKSLRPSFKGGSDPITGNNSIFAERLVCRYRKFRIIRRIMTLTNTQKFAVTLTTFKSWFRPFMHG